jgi:hypothetical protein
MFIITGWWQTVTSDDDKDKDGGFFHDLIKKFSNVHTDDYFPRPGAAQGSHLAVKFLVVSMCVAMIISIILGLCLAWQSMKSKGVVVGAFVLGILVPAVLIYFI